MKKVLHLGKYFRPKFGGIETFMEALMAQQSKNGLSVSAIVHADELQSKTGVYRWQNCTVYEAKSYGQLVFVPICPNYYNTLLSAIKCEQPDVIHIHMPNVSPFWFFFVKEKMLNNVKIIIHWHSDVLGASPTNAVRALYPIYSWFESRLLKLSHKIICTSRPYLESSEVLKNFKSKCTVVPLGIEVVNDIVEEFNFVSPPPLRVLVIARLTYYKGHSVLLDALSKLRTASIQVDIVGTGELETELKEAAIEKGVEQNLVWHGAVSENKKEQLIQQCHLLCLPSIERTEAFGVVILEGARLRKPALVSDVQGSGMTYVVREGKNGFVFSNMDPNSLASRLDSIYGMGDKLQSVGKNARETFLKAFSISTVADRIYEIYCA